LGRKFIRALLRFLEEKSSQAKKLLQLESKDVERQSASKEKGCFGRGKGADACCGVPAH